MPTPFRHLAFVAAAVALPSLLPVTVTAQQPGGAGAPAGTTGTLGTLDALTRARDSRIAHYSSYDPRQRNDDFRQLKPGDTLTLVDHRGAGVVRRWWITIAPRNHEAIQRQLIVRAWWDDETTPSVEVPVSDFFGVGFGMWTDFVSAPLNMTSGGYNTYWAMPFRRRARIQVENRSNVLVDRFYYNVDIESVDRLPDDALYFHAQFRRAMTRPGTPLTLLEAEGRGHYVGTVLAMQPRNNGAIWYLEGNERVFIDGDSASVTPRGLPGGAPSVLGTGTEDYFSSGWYFDTGPYSAPYHGAPIKDTVSGRISAYRWHIEDPIPFTRRLAFTIEHGGTNDAQDVDYSSVAFWYQTHPHKAFPALPTDLLPLPPWKPRVIPGMIEGESMVAAARATVGRVMEQELSTFESATSTWSGARQLWWVDGRPGARLTTTLRAPAAGTYELVGYFTRARDYGDVRVSINGRALAPIVRGYAPNVEATGPISFGRVPMRAGANTLELEIVGKDARSQGGGDGYLIGFDGFMLRR